MLITVFSIIESDTYNPVPGVMDGVPASRNYDGGFATKLMVCHLHTWRKYLLSETYLILLNRHDFLQKDIWIYLTKNIQQEKL